MLLLWHEDSVVVLLAGLATIFILRQAVLRPFTAAEQALTTKTASWMIWHFLRICHDGMTFWSPSKRCAKPVEL